jgi:hypothetical protein
MLGKGLEAVIGSSEGSEFINFLLDVAGIPLAIAVAYYFLQKPLKDLIFGKDKPIIRKKFTDPKVNVNTT